jgi:hypothetical protein
LLENDMHAALREKIIAASLNITTARKMLADAEAELDAVIQEAAKPSPFDGIVSAAQSVLDKRPTLPERHPVIIEKLARNGDAFVDRNISEA